ncbi:MAG: HPF/RaiA family ribosome-associated protein [Micromonosporaceae bacterium]|nr:HPF/RaiA family ribosome-associated protein [Micromonosporaceae bacterium]
MNSPHVPATIAERLRVVDGFAQEERPGIVERLRSLDTHLTTYPASATDLELSIKDRGRPGQKVTLECWIAGQTRLVATSAKEQFSVALTDVRDELRRQLSDAKTRTEPRNNRHLRS